LPRKALFVSHGGGPLPLLGDVGHQDLVSCLKRIAGQIDKPSLIVVVSAHWETAVPHMTAAPQPPLLYDYYGFPEASYRITYPCPGSPALVDALQAMLSKNGFESIADRERGFDHGLFVPLKIMYPEADIPCVQLSLFEDLDAEKHIRLGKALQQITDDNILLLGSGFSFHNMKAFFASTSPETENMNKVFERWLIETMSSKDISESERRKRLVQWDEAPHARYCHPREDHLLPLHVCYGFMERPCLQAYEISVLNKRASMYLW